MLMFLLGKHSWPVVNMLGRLTWVVFMAKTGTDPAHGPVLIPIRLDQMWSRIRTEFASNSSLVYSAPSSIFGWKERF